MTIADQLTLLASTKSAIKQAIEGKGVSVGTAPFADYPSKISAISGATPAPTPEPWVRPADWLTLPTLTESDQKFVGLHAVYPDANFVALSAAGDYTVDWGDGVVENFAANAIAQHEYNYDTYDVGGTTLCSRGYKQAVVTITPQSGQSLTFLNLHQRHSALTVAYSSGFLDIALASQFLTDLRIGVATPGSSTQNIRIDQLERINVVRSNIKQASYLLYNCRRLGEVVSLATSPDHARTVTVTFQDAGDTVTAAGHGFINGDLVIFSSIVGTTGITAYSPYYVTNATLDTFQVASSYGGATVALTTDGTGAALGGTNMGGMFQNCYSLTSVPQFDTAAVTNMSIMFYNCYSLTSVPQFDTAAVTSMGGMFNNCYSLVSVPQFNTAAVTNMSSMFQNCHSLASVPLFNTAAVKGMGSMFYNCYSLTSVPLFDTAAVGTMGSMFYGCYSLTSVPLLNTAAVTNMGGMFYNCYSLTSVPLFNTAAVKDMAFMFNNCYSLVSVPQFNTAAVTNMSSMFQNCNSLASVPPFNTSAVGTMSNMFGNCYSLTSVPLFDTAAVTNMGSMFYNCNSLTSVPLFNTAAVMSMGSMFGNCPSLSKVSMTGMKVSFGVSSCKLSAARLNEIYGNLANVTGQTITVTGNYGTASDDPTIATAKGWTVTG